MTLRTRITLLVTLLLAASLLILGGVVHELLKEFLYRSLREELAQASAQVVRLLNAGGGELLSVGLPSTLYAEVQLLTEADPAFLAKEGGISVQKSPALGSHRLVLSQGDYAALLKKGEVWAEVALPREGSPLRLLVLARKVRVNLGQTEWDGALLVGKPTEPLEATLSQFTRIYAATALLVLLLSALLARRLVREALEPLEWVARKAGAIEARPEELPEPPNRDEVYALVRALNAMMRRMREAFEAQARFLQDASHELRTPITAILGHVGYLLRRTPVTEAQKESLEVIQREAERMRKLVEDLLELSKSGTWKVEPVPVHVRSLFEEVKEEFSRQGSEIALEVADDLFVLGDPDRLHQVLANLVANSLKAKARRVVLRGRGVEKRVILQVEDDGEGIPKEHLPHIFERFYRVDRARDRERGGSGLGLAIVKAILEAHGGEVWVESEPGRGTTFTLSLPASAPPPPPA
ncbi:sensor histidine kinase [Thermus filiformis]|uniref:histidine kinase n=1 Tax=Thermus filiformis TaxID=276 RepID=A0A0A2WNZ8_THEFI|nr:ATP-binding protein [Thermus filiformis]KGQ21906.2 histidine kinase [Thermus filiformis]